MGGGGLQMVETVIQQRNDLVSMKNTWGLNKIGIDLLSECIRDSEIILITIMLCDCLSTYIL